MWKFVVVSSLAACSKPAAVPPAATPTAPTPVADPAPVAAPSKIAPLFADLFVAGKSYTYQTTTKDTDAATGKVKTDTVGDMTCKSTDLKEYATGSVIALDCEIGTVGIEVKFFFIATATGLWISGDSSDQAWFDGLVKTPPILVAGPVTRDEMIAGERYATSKRADGAWCGSRSEDAGAVTKTVCFAPGTGLVTIGSLNKLTRKTAEQIMERKR